MLLLYFSCYMQPKAELAAVVSDTSGQPLSGVSVEIKDSFGEPFSVGESDEDGYFRITLPPLQTFFTILSTEGYPTTSFTGFAGEGLTEFTEGNLRLRSNEELNAEHMLYQGCETTKLSAI